MTQYFPCMRAATIVEGRLEKYYQDHCLMEQAYIRSNKQTIRDLINEQLGKLGEKILVRRFVRFRVGEGVCGPIPVVVVSQVTA